MKTESSEFWVIEGGYVLGKGKSYSEWCYESINRYIELILGIKQFSCLHWSWSLVHSRVLMACKFLLTTTFHMSRSPYGKSGILYEDEKTRFISRLGY